MANIIYTFQRQLSGLEPKILLVIAVVTIASGIFAALGGLGFRKAMFMLIGLYCGGAFIVSGKCTNIWLAVAAAGIGIVLATALQDTFLVLLVSLIAAVYGFAHLIHPYVNTSGELINTIRDFAVAVPFYNWPLLLILIFLPVAARASWWHGTAAVLCSLTGASLILSGILMLYIASGLKAAEGIFSRREIYLGLIGIIVVIGTIVQMLILPRMSKRMADSRATAQFKKGKWRFGKKKSEEHAPPKSATWRTA